MYLPELNNIRTTREVTDVFYGYANVKRADGGVFAATKNLTSDYFPVMSQRDKRTHIRNITKPNGLYASDGLVWCDDKTLYYNGTQVDTGEITLSDSKKTFVRMGAWLCIFPDKLMYNTVAADEDENEESEPRFKTMEHTYESVGTVYFEPSTYNGGDITYLSNADVEDQSYTETDGDYWLKDGSALMRWSASAGMWYPVATAYIRVGEKINGSWNEQFTEGFKENDVVEFTSPIEKYNGTIVIYGTSDDGKYLIIAGITAGESIAPPDSLKIERLVPDMDYVCEHNNRLWGCSSKNHAIYSCKLGDPTNWNTYAGLADDAYAVTIGSPGEFTGCISHRGYILFFKEQCIHKIYGDYPGNYQIMDIKCRGVEKGSEGSLCIINEVLYYKGRDCVCAFDGSISGNISDALGKTVYHEAVAGGFRNKYMISMCDDAYTRHTFTYDTVNNIWIREDEENIHAFANDCGALYYMTDSEIKLVQKEYAQDALFPSSDILLEEKNEQEVIEWIYKKLCPGMTDPDKPDIYPGAVNKGSLEGDVEWSAETHDIGMEFTGAKYVSKIILRLSCEREFNLDVMYDSDGIWENVLSITGTGKRSVNVPVRVRRCDHCRFRMYGSGDIKLYSMAKTIEAGADT